MQTTLSNRPLINARPFLKWAGGKTQLLDELARRLPVEITETGTIENYVEPFIGGGAMFFYLKSRFEVKKAYLLDVNPELVVGYTVIQRSPSGLVKQLKKLEADYLAKQSGERSKMYYEVRESYNRELPDFDFDRYCGEWVNRAAQMIFLNKTCFNGLFRQNSKGEFNVPFGKYKNPTICDSGNISEVSQTLKDTQIICGDFSMSKLFVDKLTLVYLDPPSNSLNLTSNFNGYTKNSFDDNEQKRLAKFFHDMSKRGAYLILSNNSSSNKNNILGKLYFKYHITNVYTNRMINSDATNRGPNGELIITNYTA
jgi:DNA adenine methylase (dam)